MSKMSDLDLTLQEYEENLHAFGYMDPMVQMLKRELLGYGLEDINTLVQGIELEFDTLVFNGDMEMF